MYHLFRNVMKMYPDRGINETLNVCVFKFVKEEQLSVVCLCLSSNICAYHELLERRCDEYGSVYVVQCFPTRRNSSPKGEFNFLKVGAGSYHHPSYTIMEKIFFIVL